MAEFNPAYTEPTASPTTELYYATTEDTGLKQVFGVQGVPTPFGAPDDITYRTLESWSEFGVPGVSPFTAIEVSVVHYKEQYTTMEALNNTDLWWYIKLPTTNEFAAKWKGKFKISLSDIELDNMIMDTLKIYKSTTPEILTVLPV